MNVPTGRPSRGSYGGMMVFSKQGKPSGGAVEMLYMAGTIGLQLVCATFVGLAMGYFLDKWLGTSPWLLIFFLLMGIVAGFRDVYREARRIQRGGPAPEENVRPGWYDTPETPGKPQEPTATQEKKGKTGA